MAPNIVCKCPNFTNNLFSILGILLVFLLVVRFFSKIFLPDIWNPLRKAIAELPGMGDSSSGESSKESDSESSGGESDSESDSGSSKGESDSESSGGESSGGESSGGESSGGESSGSEGGGGGGGGGGGPPGGGAGSGDGFGNMMENMWAVN